MEEEGKRKREEGFHESKPGLGVRRMAPLLYLAYLQIWKTSFFLGPPTKLGRNEGGGRPGDNKSGLYCPLFLPISVWVF